VRLLLIFLLTRPLLPPSPLLLEAGTADNTTVGVEVTCAATIVVVAAESLSASFLNDFAAPNDRPMALSSATVKSNAMSSVTSSRLTKTETQRVRGKHCAS
jgi:hypothetical protein